MNLVIGFGLLLLGVVIGLLLAAALHAGADYDEAVERDFQETGNGHDK